MPPRMDPIRKHYLDAQLDQEAKLLRTKKPPLHFRASELGKCKREIACRLAGYIPRVFGARGLDYGRVGDLLHDSTRHWMKDIGMKMDGLQFNDDGTVDELEQHFLKIPTPDGEVRISMRLDGRVKLGRKWYVLELKSLGWGKLKGMRELWERSGGNMAALVGWIKDNRRDIYYQCHACMAGAELKGTYMVPIDRSECATGLHSYKDPGNITGGVLFQWEQGVWDQIIARCQVILRKLKKKELPDGEFLASSKECKNCNYRHLCHDAFKRERKGLEPFQVHPTLGEIVHVKDL